jgi:hypothetical protein
MIPPFSEVGEDLARGGEKWGKAREPLGVATPAARLKLLRVDWLAQPSLDLAQNYFRRTS